MTRTAIAICICLSLLALLVYPLVRPKPAPSVVTPAASPSSTAPPPAHASSRYVPLRHPTPVPVASAEPQEAGEHVDHLADCDQRCESECVRADGRGGGYCARPCTSDADCGPNRLCVFTGSSSRCLGSQCAGLGADTDCGEHATCAIEAHPGGSVFRCARAGVRKVSEPCGSSAAVESALCDVGLACANGRCVPASCDSNEQCPKGTRCASYAGGLNLKSCQPSCENDADCPDGDQCATVSAKPFLDRQCVRRESAQTCPPSGCPEGQVCQVTSRMYWNFRSACVTPCSGAGEDPACTREQFCARASGPTADALLRCYRKCRPDDPTTCEQGSICTEKVRGYFACRPDYEAAERAFFGAR